MHGTLIERLLGAIRESIEDFFLGIILVLCGNPMTKISKLHLEWIL